MSHKQKQPKDFDIYLSDLKDSARDRLLRFLAIKEAKEGNYDVFPIAVVMKPERVRRE